MPLKEESFQLNAIIDKDLLGEIDRGAKILGMTRSKYVSSLLAWASFAVEMDLERYESGEFPRKVKSVFELKQWRQIEIYEEQERDKKANKVVRESKK